MYMYVYVVLFMQRVWESWHTATLYTVLSLTRKMAKPVGDYPEDDQLQAKRTNFQTSAIFCYLALQ